MGNNLHKVEKDLRSIAKRYKSVKYSLGLAILFLMLGISAFSEEVNLENSQIPTREELKTSVGDVQTKLNVLREENKEKIKNLRLELIQLMEQGDQIIKSSWSSWQFGANYFYENWNSSYKGSGDKAEKYLFNGIYTRGDWKVRNAMDSDENAMIRGRLLTPGNDSQSTWKTSNNTPSSGAKITRDTSISSSTNGNRRWGLVKLEDLKEPTNEVEILARISPKDVNKQAVTLNISAPTVQTLEAPIVKPEPNKPIEAPKINLPKINKVEIEPLVITPPNAPGGVNPPSIGITIAAPTAPTPPSVNVTVNEPSVPSISVNPSTPGSPTAPTITINVAPPSISALNISTPGTVGKISVTPPSVSAVDFILSPAGLSQTYNFQNRTYVSPGSKVVVQNASGKSDYISVWGYVPNMNNISTDVDVNIVNTRAFMVDEGIDEKNTAYAPFRYIGTITLNKSQNVGIDVQGTHTSYDSSQVNTDAKYKSIEVVANVKVTNAGTIIGNGGAGIENQVAFGFNNFDSSTNNTRNEMINVGQITLNAPNSAGIQLRPENPNANGANDKKGLNMMTARNEKEVNPTAKTGTVDIKSYGSFGMLTVKNKNATTTRDYNTNDYKTISSIGGQFANRAQVENMSFMKNTGVINLDGDSSIGIGLLHNIQAVYAGGTINVGKNDPSTFTYANKSGKVASKTEGAVGVYAEVETRPVLKDKYDDHGLKNTTGKTVGTETVEVDGTINIGKYAKESSGIFAKDRGSITLKNNSEATTSSSDANVVANLNKGIGTINVGGEKNYGAVVDGIEYKSKQKNAQNQYEIESATNDKIGRIDLEKGTSINVTGKESIGYVMKKGAGSNSGKIDVVGHSNNNTTGGFHGSLGFYGEKGTFTNTADGTISSSGNIAHAVAIIGDSTNGFTFKNQGRINVVGAGNIGVYAEGKYDFTHENDGSSENALISASLGGVGIYAKNNTGTLNINAPIYVGNSTSTATTIGVYSDGDANVVFKPKANLVIRTGAVGLYSADVLKFGSTFTVPGASNKLNVDLGTNSTLGLFNDNNTKTITAGTYLNALKLNITNFGTGASLFYTTGGAKTEIDQDYTVSNATAGGNSSTSILVGTKGSTVKVNNTKKLTTGTNVGLIATKGTGIGAASSTALNDGTIESTRTNSGIAIYTNDSVGTNSTTGVISMKGVSAVGILGENNSILTNDGKIELEENKSAGIYGKDSNITNNGNLTKGIFVKKGSSAGIYSLLTATTDKNINNVGLIKVEGATEEGSAGIYSKLQSTTNKLTTQNSGEIQILQKGSAGIYAENISSQGSARSEVTNTTTGLIKVEGESSVGIIGKKSKITNLGTGTKGIEVKAIKSAGILGNTASDVTNSGRILLETTVANSTDGLVGISADQTSTVTNDTNGIIEIKADYSSGISSKGGLAKNDGKIELVNVSTVGILSTNASVENNGLTTVTPPLAKGIIITNNKSVGIYAKLNGAGSVDKTIKNSGTISIGGTSKKGSAGIYSILENGATKKITTSNESIANIDVNQEEAVGIYVRNISAQANTQSVAINDGKIVVNSTGSAGILAYKSKVTNSGTSPLLPTFDKGISLTAVKTAAIIGKNGSDIINDGDIVLNSGTQPTNATEGLVGISIDEISTDDKNSTEYKNGGFKASLVTNNGTITINNDFSTGISGKAGDITNNKNIILNNKNSVGIATTDGSVYNKTANSKIEVKKSNSVGIYAKATGNIKLNNSTPPVRLQNIENEGNILLNGGSTEKTSVGIYSYIDKTAILAKVKQNIKNSGTINVGTKESAGIFVKDDSANRPSGNNTIVASVLNIGNINVTQEDSAAIIGEYTNITNGESSSKAGEIKLSALRTAGIIASKKSVVTNHGIIKLDTASVTSSSDALVGISVDNSSVINKDTNAVGGIGTITVDTAYSTGIFGKNSSDITNEGNVTTSKINSIAIAGENSKLINKNKILINEKNSVGMFGTKNDTKDNQVINEHDDVKNLTGTINTKEEKSVGIFVSKSKELGINRGTILIEGKESAGMYGDETDIHNTGSSVNLVASITTKEEKSAGMYAKNSNATNKKKITIEGKNSAGILVEMKQGLTVVDRNISGTNDIADNSTTDLVNGKIEIKNEKSAGIYGIVDASVTSTNSTLNLFNKKTISVDTGKSVGMMLTNSSNSLTVDKVKAENTGVITLNGTGNIDNIGILASLNSTAINKDNAMINVNSKTSIGMLANGGSYIENSTNLPPVPAVVGKEYGINLKALNGIGMYAEGVYGTAQYSTAVNKAKISLETTAKESIGMYAIGQGIVRNEKNIEISAESGVGIFVSDTGYGENVKDSKYKDSNGQIDLLNAKSVGIFAKDNGSTYTAKNSGTINLGTSDGKIVHESLIGMFAQASSNNKTASVKNETAGIINVNTKKSVGIYGQNKTSNIAAVDLQNLGTININNKGSAGIYAPKSTVSKVGTIKLKNTTDSDGSSAVYVSEGGKVADTTTGAIDLGTINQNRVAYYINGKDSTLAGTDIGKVTGYGVGVYLEGSSTKNATIGTAKLAANFPKLHYKNSKYSTDGNGIIGLFLSGSTEIKNYTNGIIVGDTIPEDPNITGDIKKYAIGIYADKQGTTATSYEINTDITAGKEGVGIFSDNNSVIDYKGHIKVGNGAAPSSEYDVTAGIGIYITKSTGGNKGEVKLIGSKTDTSITLNGTGGVAVIASEDTKFDGGHATINLVGTDVKGVGVYAKKGSEVKIDNWTFNNNGNTAEEVRSEEGKAHISATLKQLKPKMVLSHVINGETSVAIGSKVASVDDNPYRAAANIGLMAEGIKNPNMTWSKGNYEIVNDGTIDFSIADKSTAIYANSARVNNNGTIKVGKNSTAIYGFYDSGTRTYEVTAPNVALPNKLEIDTTVNSNISLGDSSTGMYLINAENINNAGGQITSESGATKNVGIYAINGSVDKGSTKDNTAYNKLQNYKTLNMITATNITLGNGSVGLYSKGQSISTKNIVTNTGNITVGKEIVENVNTPNEKKYPAVAMYAENTKLDTNSTAIVGENGLVFYGKNSDIIGKGTANFNNKGTLAYLDKSNFTAYYGDLTANQKTMLFVKDSTATLNGLGPKIDITVNDKLVTTKDAFAGVYVEGKSYLNGVKKITVGRNSNGIFLKDAIFTSNVDNIISTKEGAKGLLALNSNLTTNSKINLSGDNSIGIYSDANNTKMVVNNGELTLSGKQTLGVFLKGTHTFENNANINIANSSDSTKPTIGIYTANTQDIKDGSGNVIATNILNSTDIKHSFGTIEVGEKSIGIYSRAISNVDIESGKLHIKDQATGIYKEAGKLTIKGELDIDTHVATTKDSEPTGVYAVNGAYIDDQSPKVSVGAKSYGFILNNTDPTKTNIYTNTGIGTVSMGNDSVFLYSNGKANITNNRSINANGSDHLIAFYIKNGGEFTNNGTIDFSTGKGNIGIYAPGGKATNKGKVYVGATDDRDPITGDVYTDVSKIVYGIGMATDNGGHIVNDGEIRIYNPKSIGMYGSGPGTIVENGVNGKILLDGSKATATNKIESMTGVYVDEGATFRNYGTIKTTDSYAGRNGKVNENVSGLLGVAIMNGSTLENYGSILIDADNSSGVVIRGKRDSNGKIVRNAIIKNYGEIRVRGKGPVAISWKDLSEEDITRLKEQINSKLISTDPNGHEIGQAAGTNKEFQGIEITIKNGQPEFTRNGVLVSDSEVAKINELIGSAPNLAMSDIGFYVDTLGRTKPVQFQGVTPPVNSQLIIGTEYSERTNKKEWFVSGNVIKPFLNQIQGRNFKLTTLAGSLTWIATPVLDNYGQITGVAMSKLSYTSFVKKEDNAYNFADGLEQRYDKNAVNSVEKRIFNKLNSIGKNEETLLTQAYDEMMGHQYANVQQRVQATGKVLDREFSYLRDSWKNSSKDSNKVKTFGTNGEYKTDTAGVIDYKYNAYGVAYVHENEDIKLGRGTGWYTGIVHNKIKFKDIGNSKEEQLQTKVGMFKSVPFDENNSLNWIISGDIFVGHNKLERKFLVVDEIFHAKSKYYTYGVGIKNELSKEFRLSEGFSIRPYGALKVEYGKISKIKEKSGEMKLEVKQNDYLSVRPEVGTELGYRHYFGTKSLSTSVGVAYENELGRVANGKNKARVADTSANWFNIRGEKEDRRGNVKVDLNVGLDNQRVGVTGNVGYDTKGSNVRGGLGLRVIF